MLSFNSNMGGHYLNLANEVEVREDGPEPGCRRRGHGR